MSSGRAELYVDSTKDEIDKLYELIFRYGIKWVSTYVDIVSCPGLYPPPKQVILRNTLT